MDKNRPKKYIKNNAIYIYIRIFLFFPNKSFILDSAKYFTNNIHKSINIHFSQVGKDWFCFTPLKICFSSLY